LFVSVSASMGIFDEVDPSSGVVGRWKVILFGFFFNPFKEEMWTRHFGCETALAGNL
jgi:hypothetical protein